MIISHKHKFVFIKTPKAAGTSIQVALAKHCGPSDIVTTIRPWEPELGEYTPRNNEGLYSHFSIADVLDRFPQTGGYFKFSFERNPWDKMVSDFWFRANIQEGQDAGALRTLFAEYANGPDIIGPSHSLYTVSDKIAVDFMGQYSTLQDDYDHICATIGISAEPLPRLKAKFRRQPFHYSYYYGDTTALVKYVARLFRWEIEQFGYRYNSC